MALALLHADDFNRSDRSLDGDTMSDGLGAWARYGGTSWSIVSNEADSVGTTVLVDSAMSDAGDQKSEVSERAGGDIGPICRWRAGGGGIGDLYLAYCGDGTLYRVSGGSYTAIAAAGGSVTNPHVAAVEAIGSTITFYKNGVSIGSATDSTYATGKCGLWGGGASGDNFADYIDAGGTTRGAPFGSRGTAFNGGRTFMGILR